MNITRIDFETFDEHNDAHLSFAVIMTQHKGQWVFVKHKKRTTLELPGGSREPNEPIIQTAKRELYEETGAVKFSINPISVYKVIFADRPDSYGLLCHAVVDEFASLPESEIEKISFHDECPSPENLIYPKIQPYLFRHIQEFISDLGNQKTSHQHPQQ